MTIKARKGGTERGAVLVVTALLMVALITVVAIVIDLGFTRSDRRSGQEAVDNAAAAAGRTLAFSSDAVTACKDGLDYLRISLEVAAFDTTACDAFTTTCTAATPERSTAIVRSEDYFVTVVHPVISQAGADLLDRSSTLGDSSIVASAADGTACERIGIRLSTESGAYFGGIAGEDKRRTSNHAVARTSGSKKPRSLNLLVLERYECDVFVVRGKASVVVKAYLDPDASSPKPYLPGIAATDSDASDTASSCKNAGSATLVNKGTGVLRADGPCAVKTDYCDGTGSVPVFADYSGTGTCATAADLPACSESGGGLITPSVTDSPKRYTRSAIDYRFNCKSDYSGESWYNSPLRQDIPGCPTATGSNAYIDLLEKYVTDLAKPTAVATWRVEGGPKVMGVDPCTPKDDVVYSPGNIYMDCDEFSPAKSAVFQGGNVIFRGGIKLSTGGSISLNSPGCSTVACTHADPPVFDGTKHSSSGSWAWFGGPISMNAGTLQFNRVAAYLDTASGISITGGALTWTPPTAGPFSGLALWSASSNSHKLTGGGGLNITGTYFAGEATLEYVGGGNQVLDAAQFVANKMDFSGNGELQMAPDPGAVKFEEDPASGLIR